MRAPVYDFYARLFHPSATAANVVCDGRGSRRTPEFRTGRRMSTRTTTVTPSLLWVALLLVIGVLGTIALHNARRVGRMK